LEADTLGRLHSLEASSGILSHAVKSPNASPLADGYLRTQSHGTASMVTADY